MLQGVTADVHGQLCAGPGTQGVPVGGSRFTSSSSVSSLLFIIIAVVQFPFSSEACFPISLHPRGGCQILLVLSVSVHSFVHSSVKPSLCARDLGSCQVVGSCFHKWLLAAWAGPHLLPLYDLSITLFP